MDIYQKITQFYKTAKIERRIVGSSLFGRNLYAFKIGEGSPVGIAQYAIHGREFITAELALAHIRYGVTRGSVWVLPLVNPDGALLSEIGLSTAKETQRAWLLQLNGGEDFSLWKANGRGVDLNVNFPAKWGKGVKNTTRRGAENYIGEKPFSEPESKALGEFTLEIMPDYTVSYHTKGEEIYWHFNQSPRTCPRDMGLAEAVAQATGYSLAYAVGSAGGYKDWCIEKLQIPAITIEAGADSLAHPIGREKAEVLLQSNKRALNAYACAVWEIKNKNTEDRI